MNFWTKLFGRKNRSSGSSSMHPVTKPAKPPASTGTSKSLTSPSEVAHSSASSTHFANGSSMRLVPAAEERKYQEIDALIKKGSQFLDAEQYEDAKVIYDQLLKSYPYHFGAYVNRGNCHLHMERYQQAIADYLRAIEIDPNLRIAYANLATAYKKTDQYQLALETYRTFLSRLPLNAKDDIELVKKWIVEVEAKISRSKGSVKWKNRRKKGETNGPSSSSVCNKTTS